MSQAVQADPILEEEIAQIKNRKESIRHKSMLNKAFYRVRRDRLTLFAVGLLAVIALLSLTAPIISTYVLGVDINELNPRAKYEPPGTTTVSRDGVEHYHVLGTDELGRDHLARLLYGGRISLMIAFSTAIASLSIGIVFGVIAGFYGGVVDDIIIWFITTLNSVPGLFVLLMIFAFFARRPETLVIALSLLGWTGAARLVRGETKALREREYVLAARAVGASDIRLMAQHIIPNVFSLLIISLAGAIGGLILTEAALSFLNFGIPPGTPTWGNMLSGSLDLLRKGPYLVLAPGLLISVTVLCMYLIGDGLRDAFDPTMVD